MTEGDIQLHLFRYLEKKGHKWICPNIILSKFWMTGEMDLCSITKSNFIYEYEIKLNKPDFKRDFEKRKHKCFSRKLHLESLPNYFTFVVPAYLVSEQDVPDYAGLIWFDLTKAQPFQVIKKPIMQHAKFVTDKEKLEIGQKLMWRLWITRSNLERAKRLKN